MLLLCTQGYVSMCLLYTGFPVLPFAQVQLVYGFHDDTLCNSPKKTPRHHFPPFSLPWSKRPKNSANVYVLVRMFPEVIADVLPRGRALGGLLGHLYSQKSFILTPIFTQ